MVSIIIPAYNTGLYLPDVISDIQSQTYEDFELIIVDNGSEDDSLEIIQAAAAKDRRIKVLSCATKSAGAARNIGLEAAGGEYIQFLDSDDRFDKHLLEESVKKAKELNTDILMFDVTCFRDEDGMEMFSEWFVRRDKLPPKDVFSWKDCPESIFNLSYSVVWNKLIRKDLIERCSVRFEEIPYGNDIFFIHRIMFEADRIAFLDRPLVRYRQNRQGALTTSAQRRRDPLCLVKTMKRFASWLKKNDHWDDVRISFLNYAALCFTGGLESLDPVSYFEVYPEAKRVLFEEFAISSEDVDQRDPDIREKINLMKDSDAREYLFWLMKSYSTQSFERLTWAMNEKRLNNVMKTEKRWYFDCSRIPEGSRVIIYGAGDVGRDYYRQFMSEKSFEVAAWVDTEYKKLCMDEVESPEVIADREFDCLILAVMDPKSREEIIDYLKRYNIHEKRVF